MIIKVLIINTVPFGLNGIASVIMNYYKAMDKKNLQMEFIAIGEPIPEYKEYFKQYGILCHVVPKQNVFKYFWGLQRAAGKGKYDIVHVHGNSANMAIELSACWLAGIRIRIAHVHNTRTNYPMLHRLLYPLFCILYTQGIACGMDAGKWLFHKREFMELKNGIVLRNYKYNDTVRSEYRKQLDVEDKIVIGHIGGFLEQKNHTFLIDLFEELVEHYPNYHLLLLGDGDLMDDIKEKVHRLHLEDKITFAGKTTDVASYLQAMDLFVLPSLHEGLPVVLVEAQAAGLPCVVADTVTKEADLTETMKFVSLNSIQEWVEAISNTSIQNSNKRQEQSLRWQKMLADAGYDIDKNANILKKCYENLVGNG